MAEAAFTIPRMRLRSHYYTLPLTHIFRKYPTERCGVGMAEALPAGKGSRSAATPIHGMPVMLVYRSVERCLRHARPRHLCSPLSVVSSAVALSKRLHTFWVMRRLYTPLAYSSGSACLCHAPTH